MGSFKLNTPEFTERISCKIGLVHLEPRVVNVLLIHKNNSEITCSLMSCSLYDIWSLERKCQTRLSRICFIVMMVNRCSVTSN